LLYANFERRKKLKIKAGGALENLTRNGKAKIEEIKVWNDNLAIHLWINDDVLSYLDITEAIELRNELNDAIKKSAGV